VKRGLADMGTRHIICHAYSGWEKPHVERGFGEVQRRIAELQGYHGRDVASRQELRDRLSRAERRGLDERDVLRVALKGEQLRMELARIRDELNDTPGSDGLSPRQRASQHKVRRFDDAPLLYLMFAEGAERIVGKEGVRYENADFWDNLLIPFIKQAVWVAETGDMGRLCVFTADRKKSIAIAENPERAGKDRREMAILARQAQGRFIREGGRAIGSARKRITPQVVADAVQDINRTRAVASPSLRLVHDNENPERAALAIASRALEDAAADLSSTTAAGIRSSDLDKLHDQNWTRYQQLQKRPMSGWGDEDREFVAVYSKSAAFAIEMRYLRERSA
jgi:hypothetical protein